MQDAKKAKTGKVRFGYLRVVEPHQGPTDKEPKYSTMIIIPKDDKETVAAVRSAIKAAIEEGVSSKWGGSQPKNLAIPLRDGDEEKPDSEELKNCWFINAKANVKFPPQVKKVLNGEFVKVTDPTEFVSGDYGRSVISFFPYKNSGNVGVGAGLDTVLFTQKGDPLTGSGGVNVNDEFADELENSTKAGGDDDWMNS